MQKNDIMERNKTFHRKKIWIISVVVFSCLIGLIGRLVYLMVFRSEYYTELATDLQQREREIKAARGKIIDYPGSSAASVEHSCDRFCTGRNILRTGA